MPGADQAGYSGFHDQVNNHFWKIFGDTLMLSLLSAGAQLSQPQTTSATGVPRRAKRWPRAWVSNSRDGR